MRWPDRGPARTLNRRRSGERGMSRTTSPALAHPAHALFPPPPFRVRVFGFGNHPLAADASIAELPCWRTALCAGVSVADPEEGDGRRFRLGPPRSGATRKRVFHSVTALQVRLIAAGLLVALCRPPPSHGEVEVNVGFASLCPFKIYPRSEPFTTAWQFLPVQPHIRSPFVMAAPSPRVRRVGLREDGTILSDGI